MAAVETDYGMVNATVAVCVIPPPVPVMVMVREPVAALRLTVMVMVEDPVPVMDVGLKLTVTREPLTVPLRLTGELNPPLTVLVMVTFPVLPGETLRDDGDVAKLKPELVLVTVTFTVVVSTVLPEVPVTVMG